MCSVVDDMVVETPKIHLSVDLTKGFFGHLSNFCVLNSSKKSNISIFCRLLQ